MTLLCNFHTVVLPLRWAPHQYLVLPAGFDSVTAPNETAPEFAALPTVLYDRLKEMLAREPRIEWLVADRAAGRMELIQRSRILHAPDQVSIAVLPLATGKGSTLAIYSRTRIWYLGFDVNRARVRRWNQRTPPGGNRAGVDHPRQARRMAQELLGRVVAGEDPTGDRAAARGMPTLAEAFKTSWTPIPSASRGPSRPTAGTCGCASATGSLGRSTRSTGATSRFGSISSPNAMAGPRPTRAYPCCDRSTGAPASTMRACATRSSSGSRAADVSIPTAGDASPRPPRFCRPAPLPARPLPPPRNERGVLHHCAQSPILHCFFWLPCGCSKISLRTFGISRRTSGQCDYCWMA